MPSSSLAQISSCTKYPGHKDFISFKKFTPEHLCAMKQNPKLYDLIKSQGALTLKVRSRTQKKLKQAGKPKSAVSVSTAFVIWVEKRSFGIGQNCQCSDCISKNVSTEHNEWYDFIIITSTLAVSSQAAANGMKLEFNFDDGHEEKTQIVEGNCQYVKVNKNICQLHCLTTDLELGRELKSHYVQFEGLVSNAFDLIKEDAEYLFSFTVSHPHGCEKHISYSLEKDLFKSFGGSSLRFMEKNMGRVIWPSIWNYVKVLYQVPTCNGSSGAIVITLSRKNGIIISLHLSGSKRMSWTKETNVKHFCELLQPEEDPDRDEDTGPRVKFGTDNKGIAEDRKDQLAEENSSAPDGSVKVLPNRPIVRVIKCEEPPPQIANSRIKNKEDRKLQYQANQCSVSTKPDLALDDCKQILSQCQVDKEPVSVDQILTLVEDKASVSQCQVDKEPVSVDQILTPMQIPTPIEGKETVSQCHIAKELVSVDQILTPIEGKETVSQCQIDKEPISEDQIPTPTEGKETVSQCHVAKEPVSVDQILTPIEGKETVSQCQVDKEPISKDQIPTPTEGKETVSQCQVVKEAVSVDQIPRPLEGKETVSQCQFDREPVSIDQISTLIEGKETVSQCHVDQEAVFVNQILTPIEGEEIVSQCQVDKEPVSVHQIPTLQCQFDKELVSVDQIPIPTEGEEIVSQCQVDKEPISVDHIPILQCQFDKEAVSIDQIPIPTEGEEIVSQCQVDKEPISVDHIPILQCQFDKEAVSIDQIPIPTEGEEIVSQCQVDKEPVSVDQIPTLQCQFDKEPVSVDQITTPTEDEEKVSQYQIDKGPVSVDQIPTPSANKEKVSQHSQSEQGFAALHSSQSDSNPMTIAKPRRLKRKADNLQADPSAGQSGEMPGQAGHGGVPESEFCFGHEADCMLKYNDCDKNPGHESFFHFKELKIDNLPDGYRDENILNFIHDIGALTVKVSTRYVSRKRPEFHPHTGHPYLFHNEKGTPFLRVGTGFAVSTRHISLRYGQACQCAECVSSNATRYDCYQVIIMTATHNVFDQAEANNTDIQFSYFMDSKEVDTKVLKGKCLHSVINEDVCWLEYCTHDETLIHVLRKHIHHFQEKSLNLSYQRKNDGFVTMVSHPHGSQKQHVSFGKVLSDSEILSLEEGVTDDSSDAAKEKSKRKENKPLAFQFYQPFNKVVLWPGDLFKPIVCQQFPHICYTTPTCRGSSGALILVHQPGVGNVLYTHWGSGNQKATYNRSGGGTVFFLNDKQILPN